MKSLNLLSVTLMSKKTTERTFSCGLKKIDAKFLDFKCVKNLRIDFTLFLSDKVQRKPMVRVVNGELIISTVTDSVYDRIKYV